MKNTIRTILAASVILALVVLCILLTDTAFSAGQRATLRVLLWVCGCAVAWSNYQTFSEPYKRIRVAYIDAARNRPDEFSKRLKHFLKKTRENKRIVGYGGIDKYYK